MERNVLIMLSLCVALALNKKCSHYDSRNVCDEHKKCTWDNDQQICLTKCKYIHDVEKCQNQLNFENNHGSFLSEYFETKCIRENTNVGKKISVTLMMKKIHVTQLNFVYGEAIDVYLIVLRYPRILYARNNLKIFVAARAEFAILEVVNCTLLKMLAMWMMNALTMMDLVRKNAHYYMMRIIALLLKEDANGLKVHALILSFHLLLHQ